MHKTFLLALHGSQNNHHGLHLEALDGLVLWYTASAVGAADEYVVAAAVLIATSIPPFLGHPTFAPNMSPFCPAREVAENKMVDARDCKLPST